MIIDQEIYTSLKRIWKKISPKNRRQLYKLILLMFFSSLAEGASIGAMIPFLGIILGENTGSIDLGFQFVNNLYKETPFFAGIVLFISIVTISGFLRLLFQWRQYSIGYEIGGELSSEIYKRSLLQPYIVQVSRNSSEVISGVYTKANRLVDSAILPTLTILSSSLVMVVILIALIGVSPRLAITTFVSFGAFYFLIVRFFKARLQNNSEEINERSTKLIKLIQEGLGGIRDVLLDGTQQFFCELYRKTDAPLRKALASSSFIGAAPRFIVEPFAIIAMAIIAFTLSYKESPSVAIPLIAALAMGAQRMLPALQQIYLNWSVMKASQSAIKDALDLLDQPISDQISCPSMDLSFNEKLEIEDISYAYPNNSHQILKDINITIKKGQKIGIIGTTGCGKSTLLDIIMGLLEPNHGAIKIDGVPISFANSRSWQMQISHVPQSIFLCDGTIVENIAFGVPFSEIDGDKVITAAKLAQLDEVIQLFPDKFLTKIGERGIRLSGGQRQRIGIARAFYKSASIIVLDEATSALDDETERMVMNSLESYGSNATILIIAHRLSTLKNCDQIIRLDNGRVSHFGSYDEVIFQRYSC